MHPTKPGTAPTAARVVPRLPVDALRTSPKAPVSPAAKQTSPSRLTTPGASTRDRTRPPPASQKASTSRRHPPNPAVLGGAVTPTDSSHQGSRPTTQPGTRRQPGSIVIGDAAFHMPPLKEDSGVILTPKGTRKKEIPTMDAHPSKGDVVTAPPAATASEAQRPAEAEAARPLQAGAVDPLSDPSETASVPGGLAFSGPRYYAPKNMSSAVVDAWPARSPAQSISWSADSPRGAHTATGRLAPKPPLLKSMEAYLDRELALLTPEDVQRGGRLRIFREVLRLFADNFKTYGGLLSAAVTEYEMELGKYRAMESRMMTMETSLRSQKMQAAEDVQDLHDKLAHAEATTESERNAFDDFASEAHHRQVDADSVVREVLGEMNDLRSEREADMSKMLTLVRAVKAADTRIKNLQERNAALKQELQQLDELKKCLAESEMKLAEVNDLYQDTIPRRTYDTVAREMQQRITALQDSEKLLRRQAATRAAQVDRATRVVKQLTAERDSYKREDRSLTPRPELEPDMAKSIDRKLLRLADGEDSITTAARVQALVEALEEERAANAELRDENQQLRDKLDAHVTSVAAPSRPSAMGVLLPRLMPHTTLQRLLTRGLVGVQDSRLSRLAAATAGGGGDASPGPTSLAEATAANAAVEADEHISVKPYLRLLGSVPRTDAAKRDLTLTLSGFWEYRRHDRVTQPDVHESLYRFFAQRGTPKAACARAANFIENAQRYRYVDARFELFFGIIDGIYPERLQLDVSAIIDGIRQEIKLLAGPERSSRIRKGLFMDVVGRKIIDYKTPQQKDQLKQTLGRDPTLDVEDLSSVTHPFMDTIVLQGCEERIDVYTRIVEAFTQAANPEGVLTHDDVNNCFFNVDDTTSTATVVEFCKPDPLAPPPAAPEGGSSSAGAAEEGDAGKAAAPAATELVPPSSRPTVVPLSLLMERLAEVSITREPADPV